MSNLARQYQQQRNPNPTFEPKKQTVAKQVKNSSISKGEKVIYTFVVLTLVAIAVTIISNYAFIYQSNLEIHQTERAIQQQMQINEGLQLQVIELSAPDRILHIATETLGMTLNDNNVKVIQN